MNRPTSTYRWLPLVVAALLAGSACGDPSTPRARDVSAVEPTASPSTDPISSQPKPVLMPTLVGLPSAEAQLVVAELESELEAGLELEWGESVAVRCGRRPGTIAHQEPPPGTELAPDAEVLVRTAELDLTRFRGPCDPEDGDLGPVNGKDAELARQFYRFAADPSLGAPFATGDVWIGIEDGPVEKHVPAAATADPATWLLHAEYAEMSGSFSALDLVASSGGYLRLQRGIAPTCPNGNDRPPPELAGLRAITLLPPADTTDSCMQVWGVTLFLDDHDRIAGVALRIGSP